MHTWLADTSGYQRHYEAGVRKILISFAYVTDGNEALRWIQERPSDSRFFLDSGAFGVFTGKAGHINLKSYCDFVLKHGSRLEHYASLDVIGNWQKSAENYDEMVRLGFNPVPTFHKGSPWKELERLAEHVSATNGMLALGGMAGKNVSQSIEGLGGHLDACFRIIGKHWPLKVHAFGVVSQELLERYPFYSADSSTPILNAGLGQVMKFMDGRLIRGIHWTEYSRTFFDESVMDFPDAPGRTGRAILNVLAYAEFERYLTDVWTAKGVTW